MTDSTALLPTFPAGSRTILAPGNTPTPWRHLQVCFNDVNHRSTVRIVEVLRVGDLWFGVYVTTNDKHQFFYVICFKSFKLYKSRFSDGSLEGLSICWLEHQKFQIGTYSSFFHLNSRIARYFVFVELFDIFRI